MPKSVETLKESVIGRNILAPQLKTSPKKLPKISKEKTEPKTEVEQPNAKLKLAKFDRRKLFFFFFLALFILGANLLILGLIYKAYRNTILSFEVSPVAQIDISQRKTIPVRVEIPSQNIDLPIFEAKIVSGIWETSQEGAT